MKTKTCKFCNRPLLRPRASQIYCARSKCRYLDILWHKRVRYQRKGKIMVFIEGEFMTEREGLEVFKLKKL